MQFQEGKRIKKVEGIPLQTKQVIEDVERDTTIKSTGGK